MPSVVSTVFLCILVGGLTAVIWTDFAQTAIMLIGASVLAVLSKL